MDPEILRGIAREAQNVARLLSPYQNLGTVVMPAPWFLRIWRMLVSTPIRKLFNRMFKWQHPAELNTKDVTRLCNALLNAGNALEMLVNTNEAVDRTLNQENEPCPISENHQT